MIKSTTVPKINQSGAGKTRTCPAGKFLTNTGRCIPKITKEKVTMNILEKEAPYKNSYTLSVTKGANDKIYDNKDFECNGNIINMLIADQMHDFLGSRATKKTELDTILGFFRDIYGDEIAKLIGSGDQKQFQKKSENFIEYNSGEITVPDINKDNIKKFSELRLKKFVLDNSMKTTISQQKLSEIKRELDSFPERKLKLGKHDNFTALRFMDEGVLKHEDDLGVGTRVYTQNISKIYTGIDPQETGAGVISNVHIDALKSNKNLITAMINLPITTKALGKFCDWRTQSYMKQIKFTPLVSNLYDAATLDNAFTSSSVYYSEETHIQSCDRTYNITDTFGNILSFKLSKTPNFYEIAKYFVEGRDSIQTNKFISEFEIDIDKNEFLYHNMIDNFKKFYNTRIKYSNEKNKDISSLIKEHFTLFSERWPIDNEEIIYIDDKNKEFSRSSKSIRHMKTYFLNKLKNFNEDEVKRISTIIIGMVEDKKFKQLELYKFGCDNNVKMESYINNFITPAYITYLGIKDKNGSKKFNTERLTRLQYELNKTKGPSVENIITYIKEHTQLSAEEKTIMFFLKTLGDLGVTLGSFCGGVITIEERQRNINYIATFDTTSAMIATTLSKEGVYLYPFVLFNVPSAGMFAYAVDFFGKEFTLSDIVRVSGKKIIDEDILVDLENSKENCQELLEIVTSIIYSRADNDDESISNLSDKLDNLKCYNEPQNNKELFEKILFVLEPNHNDKEHDSAQFEETQPLDYNGDVMEED